MPLDRIHRQHVPNDFQDNELLNVVLQHLIANPIVHKEGKIFYNSFKKIPFYSDGVEWIPFFGKPVQFHYASQALMLAAQPIHNNGYLYYRSDEDIYYEYLGTVLGTMADYNPIGGSGIIPDLSVYVPYIGATGNVNLGEYGLTSGFLALDITPTSTPTSQGTMYWDAAKETVALIMNGSTQHVGHDVYYHVKNSSGALISKGKNVRFAGTDGASGHILIEQFIANRSVPSSYYMGVTAEDIPNGEFGKVVHFGELEGFNTSGYSSGALLYASTTVAGGFQTTVPIAPNNIILVAATLNSKINGEITIRPTLGSDINNDEGVKIISPINNNVLLYKTASGLWENATLTPSDIGAQVAGSYEPAFVKGSIIAGTNVTLEGTIANRLVGTGDITINATVPAGQTPVNQIFDYLDTGSFTLSYSGVTPIWVALNGQILQPGALYDWVVSGSTLTVTAPLSVGDEISILYYVSLPFVTNYVRNIDGGAPDSIYLAIQNVNGGTP